MLAVVLNSARLEWSRSSDVGEAISPLLSVGASVAAMPG
jgi:hypothetical protein